MTGKAETGDKKAKYAGHMTGLLHGRGPGYQPARPRDHGATPRDDDRGVPRGLTAVGPPKRQGACLSSYELQVRTKTDI